MVLLCCDIVTFLLYSLAIGTLIKSSSLTTCYPNSWQKELMTTLRREGGDIHFYTNLVELIKMPSFVGKNIFVLTNHAKLLIIGFAIFWYWITSMNHLNCVWISLSVIYWKNQTLEEKNQALPLDFFLIIWSLVQHLP